MLEIGDEVLEILEAHRAAEQPGRDPGGGQGRVVELAMGRRRWMADDREDAPELCRSGRDLETIDERAAGDAATLEVERQHATAQGELTARDRVLGMA